MTLETVLSLLRRRWLPLAICLVAALAGSVAHLATTTKTYSSSARLFVNIPVARDTQEALQGVQLSSQLIQSYAEIVQSRSAAEQIKSQLNLPDSAGAISHRITATPSPNTLIITVTATDASPARAQAIAQAAANVLNNTVRTLEHDRTPSSAVEASIIDAANHPTAPSSPRILRTLLIGLALGLLAGLVLALILEALDRTLRTAAATESLLDVPALAVVPQVRDVSSLVTSDSGRAQRAAEAYRGLRTSLRFRDLEASPGTLVVTSADDGEGKTTTAANLAMALAQDGQRVALVDADLRKAGLTKLLGAKGRPGLSDVINGTASLDDVVVDFRDLFPFVPAGVLPANPAEMVGSAEMIKVLQDLSEVADVVLIDAPPALAVTDAVVLSALVDGTLLVVRHGHSDKGHVANAARRLHGVHAQIVGFVFNGAPRPNDEYADAVGGPAAVAVRQAAWES
ncbi:MAG TPA: polysaccharide biosynthesis tyrosine autokinase [Mycobacteriales bacterium]|nr:polysaccharide biosynthesis tyrosine autokinase [Mycobacteriales bacterium]